MEGDPASWQPVAGALVDRFDVVALDLPWRKGSDHHWRHRATPGRLLTLALARVGAAPDVVVAHSLGGAALLELLASGDLGGPTPRCPVVVAAPLLPAARPDVELAHRRLGLVVRDGVRARLGARAARMPRSLVDHMSRLAFDGLRPGALSACLDAARCLHAADLEAVDVPVLLLGAADDAAVPLAEVRALAERLPHARTGAVAGCGHHIHLEQPEHVVAAVHLACAWPAPTAGAPRSR
jgi:pimeloyl-ACP methyl ester carboxylesterase